MQGDEPLAQGVGTPGGDSEESAEAVVITRLKYKGPAAQPRLSAVARDLAEGITKFWRVHAQLTYSELIPDANRIEIVSIPIVYSLDVPRPDGEGETEKK